MKVCSFLFATLLLVVCGCQPQVPKEMQGGKIVKKGGTEEVASFRKDGGSGYIKVERNEAQEFVLEVAPEEIGYYIYVSKDGQYFSLFVNEGAEVVLNETESGIVFEGDNVEENKFMREYRYLGYDQNDANEQFSEAWLEARKTEVARLVTALEAAPVSDDFKKKQKAFYVYTDLRLRLESPINLATFRGITPELAPNYYTSLQEEKFEDPNIVYVPKWWQTIEMVFEQLERDGVIPVSTNAYFEEYAKRIESADVCSAFLLELLNNSLDRGCSNDFPLYAAQSEKYITKPNEVAKLQALNERYAELVEANKSIMRGADAPDFTGLDTEGNSYKLSDYKGKVVLIDFWFTGCAPCKAEMPYLEKMAREMEDQEIVFISLSLDTGDVLMKTWREFVAKKGNETLNLNLPGGFRSQECKNYLIKGVPRIVIVDKEGKIVDAYAKRPSDPKLRKQLEELL